MRRFNSESRLQQETTFGVAPPITPNTPTTTTNPSPYSPYQPAARPTPAARFFYHRRAASTDADPMPVLRPRRVTFSQPVDTKPPIPIPVTRVQTSSSNINSKLLKNL